jgi:hypothetical protein
MTMPSRFAFIAALFLLGGLAMPASAQSPEDLNARIDMLFGEHDSLAKAFDVLTEAVRDEDAATIASMVKYPFDVSVDGDEMTLEGEQDFIDNYDAIITPKIADVVGNQDYGALFANQDGVMFGNGEMWLTAICTDNSCASSYWAISAINQVE